MAALPRNALFLAGAGAALLLGASTVVHAQDGPDPQARPSRISPVDPSRMAPPLQTAVPGSAGPTQDDGPGPPVTAAQLVDGVRMCMAAVSPRFEVRPDILVTNGWSWTAPRQMTDEPRSYEIVRYFKNENALALLDYGPVVVCRFVGAVENMDQLQQGRASLIAALGAVPIDEVPRLASLATRIRSGMPQTNLANFLIAGDYTLEITLQERTQAGSANSPSRTVRAVMVESVPLPPQFQSQARTSAAQ